MSAPSSHILVLEECLGCLNIEHVRDMVIKPPSYDLRSIVDLLEKYGDGHISDSGWREVDEEEWFDNK